MQKILIISDIHLGTSRNSTTHAEVVRQANTQAEATLTALIPKFTELAPDLVVHMGDALRDTYDKTIDTKNLIKTLSLLQKIPTPTLHLLGNHELKAFSPKEIDSIYANTLKEEPTFFGTTTLGPHTILWLDLELDENDGAFLSTEKIQWLKEALQREKPTIILSHYSLIPIDSKGSFYFENEPEGMYYKNAHIIRELFANSSANLFLNAHVHLLTHQEITGTHYISNPAFSENIAAENFSENNPGIYSILEINETAFTFTSYSGTFCFAKIQGSI